MGQQESLSAAWAEFEAVNARLVRYMKTSEDEFGSLIRALEACWNMAENMQKATTRLAVTGAEGASQTAAIRQSMLEGCGVFRKFMHQIQGVSGELASAAQETRGPLDTSNQLQQILAPLRHIAFHFRLEGSRLAPEDGASVLSVYEEMRDVVSCMKHTGDAQERTLMTILDKLSAATRSVEQASASYGTRATESQERVERNLALLSEVPRDLLRAENKASALGTVLGKHLCEALVALQGHDAIRQRLEHILGALASVRRDQADEPEHALLLQRQQAKSVLELIIHTGSRIERELNGVIGSAQGIASDSTTPASGDDPVEKFEKAVDHLGSLSAEVAGLLDGEVKIGNFVRAQIDPIRERLRANSHELEALALSMRSMKRLALNVLIEAKKMPWARGIGVLGKLTSEAAERVLQLERELTEQFARLGATFQSQGAAITAEVQEVQSCRAALIAHRPSDAFRNSRRIEYEEVARLSQEARQLQEKTEALVRSLKFVDEGTGLLGDLDATIHLLLALYPKSEKPFDLKAASAGYTMQEQHETHAKVGGAASTAQGRLTKPVEGQDYGENVELF